MFHFSAHYKTYYLVSCNIITFTQSYVTRCCVILGTNVLKQKSVRSGHVTFKPDFLEEEINVESFKRIIWPAFQVDKLFFPYQSCPGNRFCVEGGKV
jgi:hypothetical protein